MRDTQALTQALTSNVRKHCRLPQPAPAPQPGTLTASQTAWRPLARPRWPEHQLGLQVARERWFRVHGRYGAREHAARRAQANVHELRASPPTAPWLNHVWCLPALRGRGCPCICVRVCVRAPFPAQAGAGSKVS